MGLVLVIWFLFVDVYSLKTRWDLGQQKKELIRKTEELKSESKTLEQDIQKLENNPDLIEKIAQEEYGMKKPGEKVYKIKKEE